MKKLRYSRALAMGLLAGTIGPNAALAQTQQPAPPPSISYQTFKRLQAQPELLHRLLTPPKPSPAALYLPSTPSPWSPVTNQPPFNAGAMLQLTDGTVMVQDNGSNKLGGWWRLTPDINGSYLNGTWSQSIASLPAGYSPLYYGSAVLPNGMVIIEGGEYNNGNTAFTNLGAIYDPLAKTWTNVLPPFGSAAIGDAPSVVLANGTFMLGPISAPSNQQALFNPATLGWTITGSGKADGTDEEGFTLLPSGQVLTVDCNNPGNLTNSELYRPFSGLWFGAGSTIVKLEDTNADNTGSHEMGPQILRPNGTVFAAGATGHNAVYPLPASGLLSMNWTPAPDFPVINGLQYDVADGPAALLPSGNVLVMASPGVFQTPSHFFVFDGTNLNQVTDAPNAASLSSYFGFMLVLPTGQVMFNNRFGEIDLYTDTGVIAAGTAPVITHVATSLVAGQSYPLSGLQLNGVSQGAAYGDDYQSATNYPLVRIVFPDGNVFYARTFNHSSMSVTHRAQSSTNFTVPAGIETGAATLYAVANGIASSGVSVTVSGGSMQAKK